VCGKVRVLQSIGSIGPVENETGEIEINGKPYLISTCYGCYQLFGFDHKAKKATHYDIVPDCSSCDCPDATFNADRPEGCKHVKAIKALVAAGKLPSLPTVEDIIGDEEADALADACGWNDAA
jgi:hypothetical protein